MKVVDGEPLPPPDRRWKRPADKLTGLLPVLFFGVLIGGAVLRALLGRTFGALATGGLAGAAVWVLSQLLGIAILAGIVAGAFSLFAGMATIGRGGRGGWGGWGGGLGGGLVAAASAEAVVALGEADSEAVAAAVFGGGGASGRW